MQSNNQPAKEGEKYKTMVRHLLEMNVITKGGTMDKSQSAFKSINQ